MVKNNNPLGDFIKLRREVHNPKLTLKDVAKQLTAAGYPYAESSVAHWESHVGPTFPPLNDAQFVRVLANVLGTTPYWLYDAAGWLSGIDVPVSEDYIEIVSLLQKATPEQHKILMEVIKSVVRKEDVDDLQPAGRT